MFSQSISDKGRTSRKRLATVVAYSLFFIQFAVQASVLGAETSFNTNNWMANLSDVKKINELVIPGSHDAGMSELHHCDVGSKMNKGMVKTQKLDIKNQLIAGSRYFDIRVDYDHKELVTYHRTGDLGCNGQPLKAIMDQAITFLSQYQSETFIFKFSHIRSNRNKERETKDRIDQFLANPKYRSYLYTSQDYKTNLTTVTLGDSRGKVILVFDYDENTSAKQGKFRYHDGFEEISDKQSLCKFRDPNLTVCDEYSKTSDLNTMEQDQIAKWNKFAGLGKERLFLLSWTLTPGVGTFFSGSIEALAAKANTALPKALELQIRDLNQPPPNIVYIDYVNKSTTSSIIQYNFHDDNAKE
jgi:1-phosphatidylinositol phosphodiesterase